MKKRRNGRKREQEKGWREEYMEGKRVKKNSIWTLSRTKVVKSEIKVRVNRNIQISHGDGWKWKKDGMVTGVRMTHICLSRQPKSEINCFPETLDGMISAAPAWCSVFNDLTLGSWVKKKKTPLKQPFQTMISKVTALETTFHNSAHIRRNPLCDRKVREDHWWGNLCSLFCQAVILGSVSICKRCLETVTYTWGQIRRVLLDGDGASLLKTLQLLVNLASKERIMQELFSAVKGNFNYY